jgi:hypothetical protein
LPSFDDLECHPNFEDHQAEAERPIVRCEEAHEAWFGERRIVRNRKGQMAPYLMLGRTASNRMITVVLLPAESVGSWTAYTAWDTKKSDG